MNKLILSLIFILSLNVAFGQFNQIQVEDKCGYDPVKEAQLLDLYGKNWGYGYDDLLDDIADWELSDYIQVQSIGQSTLGREIYELSISNFDPAKTLKRRIYIHARTHPGEIQSFRVTEEIINYLSADTGIGNYLRDQCIFHIVPMYNPDGVELEYPRENANGIDIESNWSAATPEIEVQNLRSRFEELMLEDNPVEVALNMHSAYECNRFFWIHHANGTSSLYYEYEEDFVESVRSHFSEGIMPFDSHVSWSGGNPGTYPESWWFTNHEEAVMALTYEDMNCASASLYDQTAYALLFGISDYLDLGYTSVPEDLSDISFNITTYPNPVKDILSIESNLPSSKEVSLAMYNSFGTLVYETTYTVSTKIDFQSMNLSPGLYIINCKYDEYTNTEKIIYSN